MPRTRASALYPRRAGFLRRGGTILYRRERKRPRRRINRYEDRSWSFLPHPGGGGARAGLGGEHAQCARSPFARGRGVGWARRARCDGQGGQGEPRGRLLDRTAGRAQAALAREPRPACRMIRRNRGPRLCFLPAERNSYDGALAIRDWDVAVDPQRGARHRRGRDGSAGRRPPLE